MQAKSPAIADVRAEYHYKSHWMHIWSNVDSPSPRELTGRGSAHLQAKKRGVQNQLKAAEEQRKQARNDHKDARSSISRLAGSGTIDEQVCIWHHSWQLGASCQAMRICGYDIRLAILTIALRV